MSVLSWLRPYRIRVVLALVALLAAAGAELAVGLVVRDIMDQGLFATGPAGTTVFLIAAVGVVYAVATYARIASVAWLGERGAADVRTKLFGRAIELSPSFYDHTRTAEVTSRLVADTSVLQALIVSTMPSGLHSLVLLAGSATLMFLSSPRLAVLVLISVPVLVVPAVMFGRRVRSLSRSTQKHLAEVNEAASESLMALDTVQAFNRQDYARARVTERIEKTFGAARRRFMAEALLSTLTVVLVFGLVAGLLWVGAKDLSAGRISVGELAAFLFYALVAAGSFGSLIGTWSQLQRAAGAMERIDGLLSEQPEIVAPPGAVALPASAELAVEFSSVSFSYPTRSDAYALDNFSLSVSQGETVALVGPSGAGKSTVFKLLLRFYDPLAGAVAVNGTDIRTVDPHDLRSQIGLVSQDPILFDATVMENIRFGRPSASDEEVREAAEAAAVTEFVERMPDGFQTELGERGARLSVGQKQRLAIARALLRAPSGLLLLDEATSALDSVSENVIQTALAQAMKGRTCLVIAHRLSTVRLANRIVVMQGGRSAAEGTHQQLLESNPLYAELARLQFLSV